MIIGVLLGLGIDIYLFPQEKTIVIVEPEKQVETIQEAEINLVAVDQDGNGVTTPLYVGVEPGNGKVLTNIEKLLFWIDTQYSIQTAKNVAENITEIDTDNLDITYSLTSDASLIGGPSAGAALTVATIAALEDKRIREDVIITGTINPDGTIGQVGGILEKAEIAKEVGAKIFLVPYGQSTETTLKPKQTCTRRLGFIFCETTYTAETINIGEKANISVVEVKDVESAMKFLLI